MQCTSKKAWILRKITHVVGKRSLLIIPANVTGCGKTKLIIPNTKAKNGLIKVL